MNSTKKMRDKARFFGWDLTKAEITALFDSIDTLEAKVKWQAEMLESAEVYLKHGVSTSRRDQWLADLERGDK